MQISITGSRDIPVVAREKITKKMANLINNPEIQAIHFGGARGTDTVALKTAYKHRSDDRPRLVGVVPWIVANQPKAGQNALEKHADKIIELEHEAPVGTGRGYQARNVEMIERADKVVAFWNGKAGGTKNTIDAAKERNTTVEVVKL